MTEPLAQLFVDVGIRSITIEYDARWHAAYILWEELKGTKTLIIDERTGVVLMTESDDKEATDD